MIHRRGNDAHRQSLQWPTVLLIRRGRAHEFESENNARGEQRPAVASMLRFKLSIESRLTNKSSEAVMLNHVLNAGCLLLCQREGCQG